MFSEHRHVDAVNDNARLPSNLILFALPFIGFALLAAFLWLLFIGADRLFAWML